MRLEAPAATLLLLAMVARAGAQIEIGGRHQYPQFRVFSGLPGGGYGLLPNGTPGIGGAAALATPIGYTLGSHGAIGLFNTTDNSDPLHLDESGRAESSNGSLQLSYGSSYRDYHASLGVFVLSTARDTAFNVQVSPPRFGRLGVAVGVQDLSGGAGSAGTGYPSDGDSAQSIYGVGTYDFGHGIYASAGIGTHRFDKGFANASAPLTPRLRATVEHDGFNFNEGLLYGTGPFKGLGRLSDAQATFFLGLVQTRYATVGVTLTF